MSKKEKDGEPFWSIIKSSTKTFVNAEKNNPGGVVNFLFGLFLFIILIMCFSADIVDKICTIIKPDFQVGLPWYGILAVFTLTVGYFAYCAGKLIDIEKIRKP